jgi:hypothetical protein
MAWQVRALRCLWADLDDAGPDEVRRRCEKKGLPRPSVLVATSAGLPKCHAYWLLREPYLVDDADDPPPTPKEWVTLPSGKRLPIRYVVGHGGERVSEYLPHRRRAGTPRGEPGIPVETEPKAEHFQRCSRALPPPGADHTTDLSRLLRLPGTLNMKDARNGAARGGVSWSSATPTTATPSRCSRSSSCRPSRRPHVNDRPAAIHRPGQSKLPDLLGAREALVSTRSQKTSRVAARPSGTG